MYSLGVDIGTTSVVAAVDRGSGPEVVVLGASGVAVPAVVHRHDDGGLRTGEAAARRALATPHRVATAPIRRLVDGAPVVLGEHPQPAATLIAAVLRDVLDAVRTQEGDDPARLVLTRPTAWGVFREELFAQVPARLGWDDVVVVGDAVAAAVHGCPPGPATVAVLDLGGGSVDATVLRRAGRGEVPEVVGTPESLDDLAEAFDEAVLDLVDEACDGALTDALTGRAPREPAESTALARVRRECVLAREALSRDAEVLVPVVLGGRPHDVEITREAFEERIGPAVDAGVEALLRTVRGAGIADPADPGALDAVLLVGGAARTPLVARRVTEALGRTVVVDPRAPWAAALGAASLGAVPGPVPGPVLGPVSGPASGPAPGLVPMELAPRAAAPVEEADPEVTQRVAAPEPPADVTQRVDVDAAPTGADETVRLPPPADPAPAVARPDEHDEPPTSAPPAPPAPPLPPEPDFRATGRSRHRARPRAAAAAAAVLVLVSLVAVAVWSTVVPGDPADPVPAGPAPPVVPAALAPGPTAVATSAAVPRTGPSLPGPPTPGFAAVSPNGRLLYVADRAEATVTVVDLRDPATGRTTIPIPAGPPQYLTVAPDGRRVYASVVEPDRRVTAVVVLDTVARSVVATIPVPSRPFGLAVSPDGRSLWVPNQDTADVTVIDTASSTVVRDVPLDANPHWVAFSRDGTRVYVTLEDTDEVVELDPATDREISRVPTGDGPFRLAIHPTRPLGVEVDYAGGTLTAFDTLGNRRLATVPTGRFAQDVAWAPDGRFAYVVNTTDATVSVIDATSLAVTATVATPPRPTSIAVAPDGRTAYVTCEGALAVLELATS